MFAVVDYAFDTSNLNYVDKTRIAATGHSAGGNAALRGANHFGKEAKKTGQLSKLYAIYISGYVLSNTAKVLKPVRSNMGMSYALHDEGAFRNELKNGDMRLAPEALRLVNTAFEDEAKLLEVEIDRYYGDKSNRTLRVVHNERLLHPLQPYSFEATAHQIEFFEKVFDLGSGLTSGDQIWHWKEVLTLISSIAALVALVPLAKILLEIPSFQVLVQALPEALPRPHGRGRLLYWGLFIFSAMVACFSYIPLSELSHQLFEAASTREQTWFFPL